MDQNDARPVRRVVTGVDERGRSRVVWDGPAPNTRGVEPGQPNNLTDIWVWTAGPLPLSGERDDGNLPYDFPGPPEGGHVRVIRSRGRPAGYDPAKDPNRVALHEPKLRPPGRTWDRGGRNAYTTDMHKTETVDYAIMLEGERNLVLDDGEITVRAGDVVVDVGAWHAWSRPQGGSTMLYDMIAARFVDGPAGVGQGRDPVLRADRNRRLPEGVRPARRVVAMDREPGRSCVVEDGPSPDVLFDPARPGFASSRLWVIDSAPAKIVFETLHLPRTLEPPPGGSVLQVVTFPPDEGWEGEVGSAEVQSYFRAAGSQGASAYSPQAPHPYMQKTRTLDVCPVLEGEIVLVLDTQEVRLKAGDIVVQRGTRHSWSNRSGKPAVVAIASHDGMYGK
jgi:quercetin dioxygenase-like cupin family protein